MTTAGRLVPIALVAALVSGEGLAGRQALPAARPVEPVGAIVEAFRTHDLVAVSDPHGNAQTQAFLRALLRDTRINQVVDDVVVEVGNARYQDLVDRFTRGDRVALRALQPVWQNTTVPNQISADEELFAIVRAINASGTRARPMRILLGDPPIDWTGVRTRDDHFRWLAMRDSHPAAVIQVEVLAKRRKALVIYGHMHFQRRNVMSNLDMSDWRAQTLVSLVERAGPARVYSIWRLDGPVPALLPDLASWSAPALVAVRGTALGAADIAAIPPARTRVAFQNGAMVAVPKDQWRPLAIEDQLDALLYLAPDAEARAIPVPAHACAGPGFVEERLRRITLAGLPAFEADRITTLCGPGAR
jgi:hypothetical protein